MMMTAPMGVCSPPVPKSGRPNDLHIFFRHGLGLHAHDAELVLLDKPDDTILIVALPIPMTVGPVRGDACQLQVWIRIRILGQDVLF